MEQEHDKEDRILQHRAEKRAARASSEDVVALRTKTAESLRRELRDGLEGEQIVTRSVGLRIPNRPAGVAGIIAWDHDGAGDSVAIYDRDPTDSIVAFDIGPDNNDRVVVF